MAKCSSKVSQQTTHADAADSDEMDVQRLVEIDFIHLLIPACFMNYSVCFIIPV